ncbi:MAG TPA: polyketide synthase dehydratase domain-containing protein, partial [Umezawaea sp.]|nr:polyketide synthase dehydratase domain-containing protein [Umezawaea sp.]
STVTGGLLVGDKLDADYWWRNFRQPVLFARTVRAMIADGYDTFVELSPQPVLTRFVGDLLDEAGVPGQVVGSLKRDVDDWIALGESFGTLYTTGTSIDWRRGHPDPVPALDLPGPVWEHETFWNETPVSRERRTARQAHPMLVRLDGHRPTWQTKWDDHRLDWVRDHHVFGSTIVPGAAFVEAALAAARELTGELCGLGHVEFEHACLLSDDEPRISRIELDADGGGFECHSRPAGGGAWVRSARGRFQRGHLREPVTVDLSEVRDRCGTVHQAIDVYSTLDRAGYAYGPALTGIRSLAVGDDEVLARIQVPYLLRGKTSDYLLHPAVLDACFQSAIVHPRPDGSGGLSPLRCLLTGVDEVVLHDGVRLPAWCHTRVRAADETGLCADLSLLDEHGRVLAEFRGLRGTVVPGTADSLPRYELVWQRDRGVEPAGSAFATGPESVRAELAEFAAAQSLRLDHDRYAGDYGPVVRELCGRHVARCLRELGVDLAPGAVVAVPPTVTDRHRGAMAVFLGFLLEDGVLQQDTEDGTVTRVRRSPSTDVDALLEAALADHPACAQELLLVDRVGRRLAAIVTGATDPLSVLFPGGATDGVDSIYQTSPATRFHNVLIAEAVRRLARGVDPHRVIRVLEVGGGTGGLTLHVVPALPADRTEYTFTDISPAFLPSAAERHGHLPGFRTRTLDLERDLTEQGVAPGSIDLVVAANAVHATTDIGAVLARLRAVLAPGGVLALLEAAPGSRWLELTFGLTDGWWLHQDVHRGEHGPLVTAETWERVCRAVGFEQVLHLHAETGTQTALLAALPVVTTPPVDDDRPRGSRWVLLSDVDGIGGELADVLRQRGDEVAVAPTVDRLPASLSGDQVSGIVHLPSAVEADDEEDGAALATRAAHALSGLVETVRAVDRLPVGQRPRVFVVTRGQHAMRGVVPGVDGSPLWGAGLVVALEQPLTRCTMIDLTAVAGEREAEVLAGELARADGEREIALCGDERLVRRVRALPRSRTRPVGSMRDLPDTHTAVLVNDAPGTLDDLRYQAVIRALPGPGEVEIEVRSTGLNFLDVMSALDQVPAVDPAKGHVFGAECAGVVTRVGAGADRHGLAPGDRVVAVAAGISTLATHVLVPATGVVAMPEGLSFDEAASMPITNLTAWFTLVRAAKLTAGERVLVHSAAGGTGMAAVRLARHLGAEVIALAGTAEKRALLTAMGLTHVLDVTAPDFVEQVGKATGGAGVDVVLSAATGEAFSRSLACLA